MLRRLLLPALLAATGVAIAVNQWRDGSPVAAGALLVVFLVAAALLSPFVFPRALSDGEAARRSADDGAPVIYWRPGCQYCARLRVGLGRHGRRAHWVDIWADPAAAAALRALTGGDETVPTVVVGGKAHVNPDVGWVRDQIRRA